MAENAYKVLVASRLRSQTTYRVSFLLDLLGNLGIGITEFGEIYVVFHNITALGGLDVNGAILVFALANIGFSLADLAVGHVDRLPTYLRAGTLDVLLLRPRPVLAQLVASDVSLRRLGRTAMALGLLAYALPRTVEHWSPAKVVLVAITPVVGAFIFAAVFVCAAAMQFWLVEGGEFANAFTYGGSYVAGYPASILHVALRSFFAFVVPAAFTAYLPALVLLDKPGPAGLPQALGWCAPLAAAGIWALALLWWRTGLSRYTGAGG